jgi:hypothetical protein
VSQKRPQKWVCRLTLVSISRKKPTRKEEVPTQASMIIRASPWCLVMFQRNVLPPSLGSKSEPSKQQVAWLLDWLIFYPWRQLLCSSDISVYFHHTTWNSILEDSHIHSHHQDNHKSHSVSPQCWASSNVADIVCTSDDEWCPDIINILPLNSDYHHLWKLW